MPTTAHKRVSHLTNPNLSHAFTASKATYGLVTVPIHANHSIQRVSYVTNQT
jgi:hypothetical protein